MKNLSRVAVISAALFSMVVGPSSVSAQPDPPRVNVYSYTYYAEPALQNVVGTGTGYCYLGEEYVALYSGQFSAYYAREPIGWCDGDTLIYE
jgi:hypothetical protein